MKKLLNAFRKFFKNAAVLKDICAVLFFVALLIGVIIGAIQMPFPKIVTIPLASVASFIIAFISYKSFKKLGEHLSDPNENPIELKMEVERLRQQLKQQSLEHQNAVNILSEENRNLKNQMDTSEQTRNAYMQHNWCQKIVIDEPTHIMYLVKEEKLDSLSSNSSLGGMIPQKSWWERNFSEANSSRSVFLTQKIHHGNTIGFDLANIKFAIDNNGQIYMSGVECKVLHNIEIDETPSINHCWVISNSGNGEKKILKSSYEINQFITEYKNQQIKLCKQELASKNDSQAIAITRRLQKMLTQKYNQLHFVSSEDEAPRGLIWAPLSANTGSIPVMEVAIQMFSGMSLMQQLPEHTNKNN